MIPEKHKFTDEVTSAIFNKQSIRRKIANILLKGLPGSGKTSLLDRLLNKPLRVYYPSTGMCEKIVIVQIGPSSTHTSAYTCEDNTWKVTDFDESVVSQLDSCKVFIQQRSSGSSRLRLQHHRANASKLDQPVSAIKHYVKEVLERHQIKNIVDLQTKNSLYIRDTGGQVEFQESLSLLIFGSSVFIFVMRTDIDIHTKNIIQYRSANGEIINQYQSSISTMDALIQFLTSVSAIQTTEDSGASVCHKPMVFVVGTHIDKLGSEASDILDKINKMLHDMIHQMKFSHLICPADSLLKKVMYEIDNTSEEDEKFHCLRSDINQYIRSKSDFEVEYPVSYLLFCLELQNISETVISIRRCKTLAAKFYIDETEIKSLLDFLHFRVGIIQYYNVEGISDVVIKEPQVLFNKVTQLIVNTFLCRIPLPMSQRESFCQRGILEFSAFEGLIGDNDQMTSQQFLKFLLHLRVAVSFTDNSGVLKYFIPSVLNHVEKSPSDTINTVIAPLAVTFKLGHCPKGLFAMLISYLLNPEGDHTLTFDLLEDQIYQDQVSLRVNSSEDVDQICLRSHLSHLEVSVVLENYPPSASSTVVCIPRATTPNEVCCGIRLTLDNCLQLSLKKLHYDIAKVTPHFSLKCPQEICLKLHEVQLLRKQLWYMRCSTLSSRIEPPESGKFWFKEGKYCCVHVLFLIACFCVVESSTTLTPLLPNADISLISGKLFDT